MKKVILCPNPYRDSELRVCKEAKKLLDALHFQTVVLEATFKWDSMQWGLTISCKAQTVPFKTKEII